MALQEGDLVAQSETIALLHQKVEDLTDQNIELKQQIKELQQQLSDSTTNRKVEPDTLRFGSVNSQNDWVPTFEISTQTEEEPTKKDIKE